MNWLNFLLGLGEVNPVVTAVLLPPVEHAE
jgi:hypothetical protein